MENTERTKLTSSGKFIEKYIVDLNRKEELEFEKFDINQLKKDILYICENALAGAIKNKNRAIAKRATAKYSIVKKELNFSKEQR